MIHHHHQHHSSIRDKLSLKETFWGANRPLIPINERGGWSSIDEKHGFRDSNSFASRVYSRMKRYASRYWSQRATPMMTTKPSLTTTPSIDASNLRFIFLCALWYTSSALSSNTGKAILIQFRYPITLTFVQFGFVAFYCLLFMSPLVRFSRLRAPTRAILKDTLVMGLFQVGGHIFSSIAISRIPVSTVHTIKALSPLFTVAAYALLFGVSYTVKTYTSLLPLTVGVMLACSFDVSASNAVGLLCAFGSALVFVSSNIFFKKIMPSSTGSGQTSHKLDKINLLFYCSSMAFLLMIPVWMYYDLPVLLSDSMHVAHPSHGHATPYSVTYYFVMNGTVHFAQNIIAFVILSSTSPVTYSIASLIKRVAVICIAIVWFKQTVHPIQAFGIILTFGGLYMYNSAKADVDRGEKKMRRVEAVKEMMLPSTKGDARMMAGDETPPEYSEVSLNAVEASGTGIGGNHSLHGRPRATSHNHSRPPPLSVKISPPNFSNIQISPNKESRSPIVSYPSPPLSLDSPPSELTQLGNDSYRAGYFQHDNKGHNAEHFHPPRTTSVAA